MKKGSTALACVVVAMLVWLGSGSGHRAPQVLRVGYATFVPYISSTDGGKPVGLAVDLLERAAQRTGMTLRWLPVEDGEEALRHGEIDIFPIMTVTAERQRELEFSAPWWESSQSLVSLRERPLRNAAESVGKRIAIRALSYGPSSAERALPGAVQILVRDARTILDRVCTGDVDGALLEGRLIYDALLEMPETCTGRKLSTVPMAASSLPMATAARSGIRREIAPLFAAIEALAAEGAVNEIANRWVAMPQPRYSRELLAERHRHNVAQLGAGTVLCVLLLSVWYFRRALRMRQTADAASTRAREVEHRFEAL